MAKIKFSGFHGNHLPGETAEVDDGEARSLIRNGVARAATVPEAKKLGLDPEDAATKH